MSHLQVIYEDNHLIAVNKPAGVLVQGDVTEDVPMSEYVKEYIKLRYNKPGDVFLGVIHRLDRPVSGATIFARTSKALGRMNKLFQERKIQKTYMAITSNRPEPLAGHLKHFISKDRRKNIATAYDKLSKRAKGEGAKKSELDYEMIGEIDGNILLQVHPHTGRPHQIRVQLASIGCPIQGDLKYGHPQATPDASIRLHSYQLEFEHPVKREPIRITASVPDEEIWNLFKGIIK